MLNKKFLKTTIRIWMIYIGLAKLSTYIRFKFLIDFFTRKISNYIGVLCNHDYIPIFINNNKIMKKIYNSKISLTIPPKQTPKVGRNAIFLYFSYFSHIITTYNNSLTANIIFTLTCKVDFLQQKFATQNLWSRKHTKIYNIYKLFIFIHQKKKYANIIEYTKIWYICLTELSKKQMKWLNYTKLFKKIM